MTGNGFKPFLSFTKGGLGAGWGANALSFDKNDFQNFPVTFNDYEAAYQEAFKRVLVAGPDHDALSPFLPGVHVSRPAIRLNNHDDRLYQSYQRQLVLFHFV